LTFRLPFIKGERIETSLVVKGDGEEKRSKGNLGREGQGREKKNERAGCCFQDRSADRKREWAQDLKGGGISTASERESFTK